MSTTFSVAIWKSAKKAFEKMTPEESEELHREVLESIAMAEWEKNNLPRSYPVVPRDFDDDPKYLEGSRRAHFRTRRRAYD